MQKLFLTVSAIVIGVSFSSCHSQEKAVTHNIQPGVQRETGGSPAWKLSMNSQCDTDQTQCVGAYGFSLLANGTYQVGPGPAGQVITGKLTDEEFATLETALDSVLKPSFPIDIPEASGQETCAPNTAVAGKESITFNRRGQDTQILRASGTEFCFRNVTLEQADTLHKTVRALAKTYYLLPFPDACADAQGELQALYTSVAACAADSDCAYADTSFMPVAQGEMQFIVTDDCSTQGALAAANRNDLLYRQGELIQARNQARNICGARFVRAGCSQVTGFQSTLASPLCVDGACRVNSSIR